MYQAAQEERIAKQMASHPGTFSTKRWISTALADKYLQDREDKREAEEQRRAAARRAVNQRLVADVTVQLAEKERRKEEEKEREKAYAQRVYSDLRKWEDEQRARKEKEVEKKMRVRAELEAQMRANANKNVKVAMSTTERQLNTKILAAVDELNTSGKVDPLMLNTGVLPK